MVNNIEYINKRVADDPLQFIKECEDSYENTIQSIAEKIITEDGREIVLYC